jgi:peroxiredoxin
MRRAGQPDTAHEEAAALPVKGGCCVGTKGCLNHVCEVLTINLAPFSMALRFPWISNLFVDKKSLAEQLDAYGLTPYAGQLPARWYQQQVREIQRLNAENNTVGALKVGAVVPAFRLQNHDAQWVDLHTVLQRGPVVMSFYRGAWCPTCNLQLRAMQQQLDAFAEFPATLLALSAQSVANNAAWKTEAAIGFDVLTDDGYAVARQFGVAYKVSPEFREAFAEFGASLEQLNGTAGADQLVNPATFVIDQQGRIAYAFVDTAARPEPLHILETVRNSYQAQPA